LGGCRRDEHPASNRPVLRDPIFLGILSLLIPGLTIAYILPMIPWVMWIAGVAGYLILVCEAVIAVPSGCWPI